MLGWRDRGRRCLADRLDRATDEIAHMLARVRALSPQATLERGYAVLQTADGRAVRDPSEVTAGERLDARVAGGRFPVRVES